MEHKHSSKVPVGAIIISWIYFLASAILMLAGSLVIAGSKAVEGPLSNFAASFSQLALFSSNFLATSGIIMIVIGLLGIVLGIFLWRLKNWARITVVALAALSLLGSIRSIILGKYQVIGWMAVNVLIICYLLFLKSVKAAFK